MSQFNVKVCAFCGKLFQSMGPDICPECSVKLDEEFVRVREYLYDNPGHIDVMDIVNNTGVSEKAVLRFIKDGRLARKVSTEEAGLRCAICGAPISAGRLCRRCMDEWKAGTGKRETAPEKADDKQDATRGDKNNKMHTRS
jgi:predicted amidophosphoribosyltransferase